MSVRDALEALRRVLALFAGFTSSKMDDQMLKFIDAVLNSPELIKWLEGIFDKSVRTQAGGGSMELVWMPSAALQSAAVEAGVDWSGLIRILLPLLLELLKQFLGEGNDTEPTSNYRPATEHRC